MSNDREIFRLWRGDQWVEIAIPKGELGFHLDVERYLRPAMMVLVQPECDRELQREMNILHGKAR